MQRPERTCVVLQPSYLPWRGYFHQVARSDVFVFYDDVPYDKHGWRNRNRVKTAAGPVWLTIPVHAAGAVTHGTPIREVRIDRARDWRRRHRATIEQSYARAPHLARCAGLLDRIYAPDPELLAEFTIPATIAVARELGIAKTEFLRSSELGIAGTRSGRLAAIARSVGATRYLTGPSARDYLEEGPFAEAGIAVEYMAYGYPEYPQLHPPYDPQLSVLDLLLMTGPEAGSYIWGAAR